jgi:carboxylesterase type B
VPAGDLLDAGQVAGFVAEGTSLAITVDGAVLEDFPINILDAAVEDDTLVPRKPYILGSNTDEGTLFMIDVPDDMTEEEYSAELLSRYDTQAAAIELMYPASGFDSPKEALTNVFGDSALVCSTYDVARRYSRIKANKARTYVYNFNRVPPLGLIDSLNLGAFHGIEIGFVFNSIDDFGLADRTLSSAVQDFWSSFARKGKPRAGKAKWSKFKEKTWKMKRLDYPMADIENYKKAECDFWTSIYDQGNF